MFIIQSQVWRYIGGAALVGLFALAVSYGLREFNEHKPRLVIEASELIANVAIPYKIAKLSGEPHDTALPIPVHGVLFTEIDDTWGAPRSGGREHKGVDIFAKRGTPVYAAANGFVIKKGEGGLGGKYVYTIGAGGRRYYYAHLDSFAKNIEFGTPVTTDTIIGFVGNTGNATGTPPHLHLGMFVPGEGAKNPFTLLVSRK